MGFPKAVKSGEGSKEIPHKPLLGNGIKTTVDERMSPTSRSVWPFTSVSPQVQPHPGFLSVPDLLFPSVTKAIRRVDQPIKPNIQYYWNAITRLNSSKLSAFFIIK